MVICEKVTLFVCFFLFLGYIITHILILSSVWGKFFCDFPAFFQGRRETASARRWRGGEARPKNSVRAFYRNFDVRSHARGDEPNVRFVCFGVFAVEFARKQQEVAPAYLAFPPERGDM